MSRVIHHSRLLVVSDKSYSSKIRKVESSIHHHFVELNLAICYEMRPLLGSLATSKPPRDEFLNSYWLAPFFTAKK